MQRTDRKLSGINFFACLLAMSLFYLLPLANSSEPQLRLQDIEGNWHKPLATEGRKATVLIFSTVDCPVANAFAPEINRIYAEYAGQGVAFYLVHVDPDVTAADAGKHAKDFGYTFPVLIDQKHELVAKAGARITPEAVVYDASGKRAYRGRIDNRYEDYGVKRQEATKHDLRDALDDVLAGRKVKVPSTKVVGCYIPPLKGR